MSDEPLKKPGAPPPSPTVDRLRAELSANLKPGEDPLYYDWTKVKEAPPSEAAYAPPMQIQTHFMDTGDLAAIIGQSAAEAARHAPHPDQKVVIEDRGPSDQAFEVDRFGDAVPTEEMQETPPIDEHAAASRRLSKLEQRGRSSWIWASGIALAIVGAAFAWSERAVESNGAPIRVTTSADSASVLPTPVSERRESARPVLAVSSKEAAPAVKASAVKESAVKEFAVKESAFKESAPVVKEGAPGVDEAPSRRRPVADATSRSRLPSPPQPTLPKRTESAVVDPILSENPGF
jgi:hypothetical protein